jgi:hypothetical protein
VRPPSTLTISSGQPSSRTTASGTTANAPLISTRSTSPRFQRASEYSTHRRHRAELNSPGSTAATPYAEAGDGSEAALFREPPLSDDDRGRAAVEPRRIARSDRPVLANRRFQLGQHVQGGIRAIRFVGGEDPRAFLALDLDAHDLCRETLGFLCPGKALLRALRPVDPWSSRVKWLRAERYARPSAPHLVPSPRIS